MSTVIFVAKISVIVFFGAIFIGNLVELIGSKKRNTLGPELYFEKQLWMVVSLLAIALVLGRL